MNSPSGNFRPSRRDFLRALGDAGGNPLFRDDLTGHNNGDRHHQLGA